MCYAVTAAGLELLHAHDRLTELEQDDVDTLSGPPSPAPSRSRARRGALGAAADRPPPALPATEARTTAVTGRHLPALNGLRAVAVIGVVAYHLQIGWAKGGYLGVDLFFVLSGYWVTRIYRSEFDGRRWLTFYLSRWLRIAPLYYIVLLAALIASSGVSTTSTTTTGPNVSSFATAVSSETSVRIVG